MLQPMNDTSSVRRLRSRSREQTAGIVMGGNRMKSVLPIAAACALALGLAAPASAQEFPHQAIRMVVPFGPGGGTDIVGRIIAQRMQDKLGQPVVVENKPGAGGTLGNEFVANAPRDGYTIGIMTAGQIVAAALSKSLRYDTLTAFDPISQVATAGLLIVTRADYPAKDVKDLIAAAKADPGKVVFGSPGFGATQHMAAELFKQTANVNMLHVPFRTTPEVLSALLGKQVDVVFDTVSAVVGQVQSGQLKAIAVTGKDRFPAVPEVPAAIESGALPGYDVTTWYGFFAPRGTPPAVIAKLNKVINEIISEPAVKERLTTAGVIVQGSTPDAFGKFMASEYARWNKVRELAGISQRE
jgi:tripartite-type tricarboxylate transporter receptor subunit TctC